jgi:hypothetical protein
MSTKFWKQGDVLFASFLPPPTLIQNSEKKKQKKVPIGVPGRYVSRPLFVMGAILYLYRAGMV